MPVSEKRKNPYLVNFKHLVTNKVLQFNFQSKKAARDFALGQLEKKKFVSFTNLNGTVLPL